MKKKIKEKCYWKGCEEKITHKWYPNKNKGHLLVCKNHFHSLSKIYLTEDLGKEDNLTAVRVVPESDW